MNEYSIILITKYFLYIVTSICKVYLQVGGREILYYYLFVFYIRTFSHLLIYN